MTKASTKIRRDAIRIALEQRQFRLAVAILALPVGWCIERDETPVEAKR